jgi:DNA-binding transcriptional ArsR family regulator
VRLLKALGHPMRQRILVALRGRVSSPSEVAGELDEPVSNVSYHFKILAQNGAIELVKTEPRRGAIEHFYRTVATPRVDDPDHWAQLSLETRRALFDESLREIWEQAAAAAGNGGLDAADVHVSWAPLELDEEAFAELSDHLAATVDRALELHTESAARRGADPSANGARRTTLAIMHFDRADAPAKSPPAPDAKQ